MTLATLLIGSLAFVLRVLLFCFSLWMTEESLLFKAKVQVWFNGLTWYGLKKKRVSVAGTRNKWYASQFLFLIHAHHFVPLGYVIFFLRISALFLETASRIFALLEYFFNAAVFALRRHGFTISPYPWCVIDWQNGLNIKCSIAVSSSTTVLESDVTCNVTQYMFPFCTLAYSINWNANLVF